MSINTSMLAIFQVLDLWLLSFGYFYPLCRATNEIWFGFWTKLITNIRIVNKNVLKKVYLRFLDVLNTLSMWNAGQMRTLSSSKSVNIWWNSFFCFQFYGNNIGVNVHIEQTPRKCMQKWIGTNYHGHISSFFVFC